MKVSMKNIFAVVLTLALVLSGLSTAGFTGSVASAKSKKVVLKLNKTTISLKKGKKYTLKLSKKNVKKVKYTKWSSKSKSVATVTKKGKVTAKKAGKTTYIICKVKYLAKGSKKYKTKTLKCKVKVAKTSSKSVVTKKPITIAKPAPVKPVSTVKKSKNGIVMNDTGKMESGLTAAQLMKKMGQGWNLGNTMEGCGSAEDTEGFKATDYELFWQKVPTTQKTLDGIHSYGVNSVRIPVAWSNMMSNDGKYTISDDYFNRVETIMNYAFKDGMYVVLDIHYDSDWWGQFGDADESVRNKAWARYEAFWTQIANRYIEYSDHLVFESANEELGDRLNDDWVNQKTGGDNFTGTLTEDETYEVTNKINQKFVDIVRKTGGNNATRQLLIAGYNTDIAKTCDDRFVMPTDTAANGKNKLSVSVHYYTPSTYCIAEDPDNGWGYKGNWGTDEDVTELHDNFDQMKKFTAEGYGVIIGEYAVCNTSKLGVPAFTKEVMTYGAECGYVPMLWDTGVYYNRTTGLFRLSDVAKVFNEVTGAKGVINDDMDVSGPNEPTVVEESTLKKVAEWEGVWTRTGNDEATASFTTSSDLEGKSTKIKWVGKDGLTLQSNFAYWQLFATYDWSKVTSPAIRVTLGSVEDGFVKADVVQLAYTDKVDGDCVFTDYKGISGKCVTLSKKKLLQQPWIEMSTTAPGGSIVKFELFDAK